jgi:D-sedoheptulose 7-phosphate isomerase
MESDKKAAFLDGYFEEYAKCVNTNGIHQKIADFKDLIVESQNRGGKIIFAGNGASASISSHCALDYTKQGKIRSMCFASAPFVTAFVNDYGYDEWLARAIECYADEDDVVVLISSSGTSSNVVNAAKKCNDMDVCCVTLTGFNPDNPLKLMGDLNLWVDSKAYNLIECTHMFWLMAACDLKIGKSEYSVS